MIPIQIKIDDSFFEEEVKNGYLVDRKRKELWAIELDLLAKLDTVCKANSLTYCVGAGTLLGAVRHQGFIPWDDDLDIYMMRQDFDRLIAIEAQFSDPYFLQTTTNESSLIRSFARLRNIHTTGTAGQEQYMDVCRGIFIDIFPLDGISSNMLEDRIQYLRNRFHKDVAGCFNFIHSMEPDYSAKRKIKKLLFNTIAFLFANDKQKFYGSMERNLKKYSRDDTLLWGNRTLFFSCPKSRREKDDYLDLIYMPFEMLQVPVPRKYDSMLRQQYGEYMKIPQNKKGSIHGELIVSTEYTYDDPRRISK